MQASLDIPMPGDISSVTFDRLRVTAEWTNTMSKIRTLRELRLARGLTQDALAVLADTDTPTISRIESGKVRAAPRTIVKLARALGVGAKRMERLCDAAWRELELRATDDRLEALRRVDIDSIAESQR